MHNQISRFSQLRAITRLLVAFMLMLFMMCAFFSPPALAQTTTADAPSYAGFWVKPAEAGWGLHLQQQGDNIFAAWYTYAADGSPTWFTLSCKLIGKQCKENIYTITGKPLSAGLTNIGVNVVAAGTGSLTFNSTSNLTFSYTVQGKTKTISDVLKFNFAPADQVPVCTQTNASRGSATNYTDTWWGGSEATSGWGLSLSHQGDNIFVAMYTYSDERKPAWATALVSKVAGTAATFAGDFSAPKSGTPFYDINGANATTFPTPKTGSITLTFASGEAAMLDYDLAVAGATVSSKGRVALNRLAVATGATTICASGRGVLATYVAGTVQNSSGLPLAGAVVSTAGQSVVTGSDGAYKFDASSAAGSIVVLVKKSGFATTAKEVPVVQGRTTQIDVRLFADQVSTAFNTNASANINVTGAKVQIPANAIKTAAGADYAGMVSMAASYYSPDTQQGVQAFAAPYMGTDAGTPSPIVSMGFLEVKLSDTAGNPLQLKSPATLIYPASSNSANAVSVPLWFYDEAAKIWVREGQVSRQADGTYQGSVAHFTLWNADFKGVTATIKGCFRDVPGQPVLDVGPLGLRGTGWDRTLFLRGAGVDAPGDFTAINVPANMALELYSAISPSSFAPLAIRPLAPGEVLQLSCVTATAASSTLPYVVIIPPILPGTANPALAGNYVGTYSGVDNGTFNVTVSAAGVVTGTVFSQTSNQTFPVRGQVGANGNVSITTTGTAGDAQFVGTITAAGVISGTWSLVAGGGGGTFTGNRVP